MRQSKTTKARIRSIRTIILLIILASTVLVNYCQSHNTTSSPHLSAATTDSLLLVKTPDTIPSQLIQYTGMNIGFNPKLHIPNWVAWELTASETQGTEPRPRKFAPDTTVDGSVDPSQYTGSGYDRGHMAPAGDMKWDNQAIIESFLTTNIVPQLKSINSGTWKRLEEKCRNWAQADSAIYIICGPIINEKPIEYIGSDKVFVPQRFYKIILSLNADHPRAIAFIIPNHPFQGGMQKCVHSIDEIEQITGYDFFASLPDDIENNVEAQHDFTYWSSKKTPKKNDRH